MLRYYRVLQSLLISGLVLGLTVACKSNLSRQDHSGSPSDQTAERMTPNTSDTNIPNTDPSLTAISGIVSDTAITNASEGEVTSNDDRPSTKVVDTNIFDANMSDKNITVEKRDERLDTENREKDVRSDKETGLADLEKIVEAIAPEDEQPDSKSVTVPTVSVALALSLNGLQTIDVQTGSIRNLEFDGEPNTTHQVVKKAIGEPTQIVELGECPAGPITVTTWPNGLSINTANQKFIGWSVRPGPASKNLTTVTGVGIGTSLRAMKKAYTVEVFDSSLGIEFKVGQMSGLLSANAPDGVITDLWAGTNCIFR